MEDLVLNMWIEKEIKPLAVGVDDPEFSWNLSCRDRGAMQEAAQVQLYDPEGNLIWDTGRVKTKYMSVRYQGGKLYPETTYTVKLRVEDSLGHKADSHMQFRTAMEDDRFDGDCWKGAKWIGTDQRTLWAQAQAVFQLSAEMTLPEGVSSGGLIFGANDLRLMDRYKNFWQQEARKFQSYCYVRVNADGLKDRGQAKLEVYRVGYAPEDRRDVPVAAYPIPGDVLNKDNRDQFHTVRVCVVNGITDIFFDQKRITPERQADTIWDESKLNLNPLGYGGDYPCFPVLADIGAKAEGCGTAEFRNLTVSNVRSPARVLCSYWENGIQISGNERGGFYIFDPSQGGMPMLRTEFDAGRPVRAYLNITAKGIYEAYINGERVGNTYFAPDCTQYNKTHMYQVYDVTETVREGRNALGVVVGEGWWSGAITFRGENWNYYGDTQAVLGKLTLEYADGTRQEIPTAPETFQAYGNGPIRLASLFQGQVYDAYYEKYTEGWTVPGFINQWPNAELVEKDLTDALQFDVRAVGQIGTGVEEAKRFTAVSGEEVRPGVFLYDFGQNFGGIPSIRFPEGLPGQEVVIRYAEVRYPDREEYGSNRGMIMTENLRAAMATDIVYLGIHPILFEPHFTFHGFRYLEISGLDSPLPAEEVCAIALSSVKELTAGFSCSDQTVNRLFENICWSLRSNFVSIPTDCPQRNERMGWSGDLSVFVRTAVKLCNADTFLRRHMMTMRDLQGKDGRFSDIAPIDIGFGGILWGSAGITVPWQAYLEYGDIRVLEDHYDAMEAYLEYLIRNVDEKTGLQTAGELGDWLGPQNEKTEEKLLWMAYYVYDLMIMTEVANLLGKQETDRYAELTESAKNRFSEVFFDPISGRSVYSSDAAARGMEHGFPSAAEPRNLSEREPCGKCRMHTQTSYCVPVGMGIVDEESLRQISSHFSEVCEEPVADDQGVVRPAYSLMTGFIGTAWLLHALSSMGLDDIAYKMLEHREYPSWLYPVTQGATTVWERLDSFTEDSGFGGHNSMNSFNHYSFGSVCAWMLERMIGISCETPGYQYFTLRPLPDPGREITWAEGWQLTASGMVRSGWRRERNKTTYTVEIPCNTKCLLQITAGDRAGILESGVNPETATGITVLGCNGFQHQFWLEPGSYRFEVTV